jgi:hypothetical protein
MAVSAPEQKKVLPQRDFLKIAGLSAVGALALEPQPRQTQKDNPV